MRAVHSLKQTIESHLRQSSRKKASILTKTRHTAPSQYSAAPYTNVLGVGCRLRLFWVPHTPSGLGSDPGVSVRAQAWVGQGDEDGPHLALVH